jgi:hypothetical protein
LKQVLAAINSFFKQQIYPNLYAFYVGRKIRGQIDDLESKAPHFSVGPDLDLDKALNELKEYVKREDDRKKVIDDKAKSSLLVITISSTILLTGLNLIKEGKISFRWPLLVIVLLGVIYFVLSAISSVEALTFSAFYGSYPDDWIIEIDEKKTITNLKNLVLRNLSFSI